MARRVLRQLRALTAEVAAEPAAAALVEALGEHYLPTIQAELAQARGAAFVNVRRWLQATVARLQRAQQAFGDAPSPLTALDLTGTLLEPPSRPPPSRLKLESTVAEQFGASSDVPLRVLTTLQPQLAGTLLPAWQTTSTPAGLQQVLPLRERANLFGFNAPLQVDYDANGNVKKPEDWVEWSAAEDESPTTMYLDGVYSSVSPGSRVVVQVPRMPVEAPEPTAVATPAPPDPAAFVVQSVQVRPRTAYNLSDTITVLELDRAWWQPAADQGTMKIIRGTVVNLGAESLDLAERPLGAVFPEPEATDKVPLNGLYGDLEPGRWLVVSGERLLEDPRPGQEGTRRHRARRRAGHARRRRARAGRQRRAARRHAAHHPDAGHRAGLPLPQATRC